MNILIVGSGESHENICNQISHKKWPIFHVPSIQNAMGWITAYHADIVIFEEESIQPEPEITIEGFINNPLSRFVVPCILTESVESRGYQRYGSVTVWRFTLGQNGDQLVDFLDLMSRNESLPSIACSLTGVLPPAGVRQIIPIIGAGQRSGRMVVFNGMDPEEQHILWIKEGDLVLTNFKKNDTADPLAGLEELSSGWFCFIEASIDDEIIDIAMNWYGSKHRNQSLERVDGKSAGTTNLRDRFRDALASARNLMEVESILKSFLEMGIDKAAEHEDIVLMDKLADLSILLEKNELGKAIHMLREFDMEPSG